MDDDPLILRHRSILLSHAALDFDGTTHRIDGSGRLDQHTIPGRLDDAASMGGYRWINEALPDRLESGKRIFLVGPHQVAVPSDIRRQDLRRWARR